MTVFSRNMLSLPCLKSFAITEFPDWTCHLCIFMETLARVYQNNLVALSYGFWKKLDEKGGKERKSSQKKESLQNSGVPALNKRNSFEDCFLICS